MNWLVRCHRAFVIAWVLTDLWFCNQTVRLLLTEFPVYNAARIAVRRVVIPWWIGTTGIVALKTSFASPFLRSINVSILTSIHRLMNSFVVCSMLKYPRTECLDELISSVSREWERILVLPTINCMPLFILVQKYISWNLHVKPPLPFWRFFMSRDKSMTISSGGCTPCYWK